MSDPDQPDSNNGLGLTADDPARQDSSFQTQRVSERGDLATPHSEAEPDLSGNFFFPVPGKKLGKYVIKSVLGQGGMGIVLEAWDPDLHRRVAVKILGPQLALSTTARRRFLREARAAASINHPNVLTIHAVEQHGEVPFLVMELVVGRTLKAYVADKGPLDSIEVIRLSHQIALGLAAAHARGVVHRDVKPGNVMLDEGGTRVWIADFGLARAVLDNVELTSNDHAVGTPAYMSPEQVRGMPLDARSDLFGFGCLIYYMFTRHSPFQGRVTAETWNRILTEQPARLTQINPSVPPILSEIAARLLEKDPQDRYQSASEVAEELGNFLALLNQTASDQIVPLLKRAHVTRRFRPRSRFLSLSRRWVAGAGLVLLLVLAASQFGPRLNQIPLVSSSLSAVPADPEPQQPATAKLNAIRVGTDAQSDCATIAEALTRAGQPCVITVSGPGSYHESVTIAGAGFNQLQLIAESPVVWSCPSQGRPHPLVIADVSGVTVRGFDFLIQSPEAHGVEITDSAEDILLESCRFEHQSPAPKLSLLWVTANIPQWDNRVRVKNCSFHASGRSSFCVSISDGQRQGSQIEFIDCRFHALTTHLYVTDTCRQLKVSGSVFVGGNNAINLSLKQRDREYPYTIQNNTFVGVKYWLGLMDSFRTGSPPSAPMGGSIVNNLILGGHRVQGGEDQLQHLVENWHIDANWWERDEDTRLDAGRNGQLANMVSQVKLLDRSDENSPDYLVPEASSPLARSGHGGDLPIHIGAFEPPRR